ncbi:MAG: hypothetical protein ACXWUN_02585 [Allosphingosinicella sp.]
MNNAIGSRAPLWFRIVGVFAVLWNLFGIWSYLAHVHVVAPMQEMTPEQQALEASVPVWVTAAFAVAVFSGLLGSVGLLMAKAWSKALLLLSLVCLLVQMGWMFFLSEALAVHGNQALVLPIVIIAVAALLVWVASLAGKRGWLS